MTGTLLIVGLGPGAPEHRTAAAVAAVTSAEVVVGYGAYVDQCADLLRAEQEVVRGTMGAEEARAVEAVARAAGGARVALVCSGDPGVFGMAARTLEQVAALPAAAARPSVEVVPGVSAALMAGALLGAPLGDDWASLSLSDIRAPWEQIERRLLAVASAGLALALYNPRSRGRPWQLGRVLELLRACRPGGTPVGVVTDAARPGQSVVLTTLAELDPASVSMRTLLVVAGETGWLAGPWLVADRAGAAVGAKASA